MIQRKTFVSFVAAVVLSMSSIALAAEHVIIGVLAENGPEKAVERWSATAEYLTDKVDGYAFDVKPYTFEELLQAVEKKKIDYFIAPPSLFVTTQLNNGATALATRLSLQTGNKIRETGGVIFTNAYNVVESFEDLAGKRLMAVSEYSLGGWQAGYKALVDYNLDPKTTFSSIEFGGRHDSVVLAVQNDLADVGMVRTGTLEELADLGAIQLEDFNIIDKRAYEGFPFICNTALYPEWPFAASETADFELVIEIAQSLLEMSPKSEAAKAAGIAGWIDPLDYSSVQDMQRALKIGAYADK